jgi:hypothetical protein
VHTSGMLAFWRSKTNGGVKCMMDAMGTEVQNYNVTSHLVFNIIDCNGVGLESHGIAHDSAGTPQSNGLEV